MPKTRNNKKCRKTRESGNCELPSCQLSVIAMQHNDRIAVSCRLKLYFVLFYVSNDNDNDNDNENENEKPK